jgi:hypothetical protein
VTEKVYWCWCLSNSDPEEGLQDSKFGKTNKAWPVYTFQRRNYVPFFLLF